MEIRAIDIRSFSLRNQRVSIIPHVSFQPIMSTIHGHCVAEARVEQ